MANEILALEGSGEGNYSLLFLYPIAAPKQVGGSNVVPTPATVGGASALPEMADRVLDAQAKADLDNGVLAYEVATFSPDSGMSDPEHKAAARQLYAGYKDRFDVWYAWYFKYAGMRFDA